MLFAYKLYYAKFNKCCFHWHLGIRHFGNQAFRYMELTEMFRMSDHQ